MKPQRIFFYLLLALLFVAFFVPLWNADLNSYNARINSTKRANDIAYALLIYKAETGKIPDIRQAGWAFLLKDILSESTEAAMTSESDLRDSRDNYYEFNREGNRIDIYSYISIPRRVDLDTGSIEIGPVTASQAIRSMYFARLHPARFSDFFPPKESQLLHPQEISRGKCTYTVPGDWSEKKIGSDEELHESPDNTKTFRIDITESPNGFPNYDFFLAEERRFAPEGAKLVVPDAYDFIGDTYGRSADAVEPISTGFVFHRMTLTAANGYKYSLCISKLNAKPWEDGELNSIVKSFAFAK